MGQYEQKERAPGAKSCFNVHTDKQSDMGGLSLLSRPTPRKILQSKSNDLERCV